jgi:hypothetical protein
MLSKLTIVSMLKDPNVGAEAMAKIVVGIFIVR